MILSYAGLHKPGRPSIGSKLYVPSELASDIAESKLQLPLCRALSPVLGSRQADKNV
jgi:hypothetical protein